MKGRASTSLANLVTLRALSFSFEAWFSIPEERTDGHYVLKLMTIYSTWGLVGQYRITPKLL